MLYLVRHGRTEANAQARIQGRLDLDLDDVGVLQAAAMAAHVRETSDGIDEVWCTSTRRSTQTASYYGVEPRVDDRWIEMKFGVYEGVPINEVPHNVWAAWNGDPDFAPEGGESFRTVQARVTDACVELIGRAVDRNIVVVSHVTPIKTAVAWALASPINVGLRMHLAHAALCRIGVGEFGPMLHSFNETSPIEALLD